MAWNIVTWLVLPLGYLSFVLINDIISRIKYGFGFGADFIYLLVMIFPFAYGLGATFITFRKNTTRGGECPGEQRCIAAT